MPNVYLLNKKKLLHVAGKTNVICTYFLTTSGITALIFVYITTKLFVRL